MDDKTYKDILILLKKGMSIKDISIELEIPVSLVYRVARQSGNTNNPEKGGKII